MKPIIPLLLTLLLSAGCQPAQTSTPTGRYQIVAAHWESAASSHQMTIKIDTATGETWELMTGAGTDLFPKWVPIPWPEDKPAAGNSN